MVLRLIGLLCIVIGSLGFTYSPSDSSDDTKGIQFRKMSFNETKELAAMEDKYIFMDCYAVWCGPCKSLERRVFSQEAVGNYFNDNFINIKMDMERGEGPGLSNKYRITGYPTLLILDSEGNVVGRQLGYLNEKQLLQFAKKYVKK